MSKFEVSLKALKGIFGMKGSCDAKLQKDDVKAMKYVQKKAQDKADRMYALHSELVERLRVLRQVERRDCETLASSQPHLIKALESSLKRTGEQIDAVKNDLRVVEWEMKRHAGTLTSLLETSRVLKTTSKMKGVR